MPSIITTIDKILPLIPQSEPLRAELQAFLDGVFLELPEGNRHLWVQAQGIIGQRLPNIWEQMSDWQRAVVLQWQEAICSHEDPDNSGQCIKCQLDRERWPKDFDVDDPPLANLG